MSLFTRLFDANDLNRIPIHQFSGALKAVSAGKATQTNLENKFLIVDAQEKTDLTTVIGYITDAVTPEAKRNVVDTFHYIGMLSEHPEFLNFFTPAQINSWLSDVSDGTITG